MDDNDDDYNDDDDDNNDDVDDDYDSLQIILSGALVETLGDDLEPPSVVLRQTDEDPTKGIINIYPGIMRYNSR